MNNLVIGNTSQLSNYFPEDYLKISSRDIDFENLKRKKWKKIFLCFGESRKNLTNEMGYFEINFDLTIKAIDELKDFADKIIVYSTCELWNKYDGPINIDMTFDFFNTPYLNSKYKLSKYIIDNDELYNNIVIIYPFNFNSPYRKSEFLFGKVFESIIKNKKVEIGDTYFYRDIIHPKFVVEESIKADRSKIIGSGRMIFVNDFIRDLVNYFSLNYEELFIEKRYKYKEYSKVKEYYLGSDKVLYSYNRLLEDTIKDIKII